MIAASLSRSFLDLPCAINGRLVRHRQGDRLVLGAVADPQGIAGRLDRRRLGQAVENGDDGCLITIDGNHAGAAVPVLGQI